jgi:hypothetical protein
MNRTMLLVAAGTVAIIASGAVAEAQNDERLSISALAINMGTISTARNAQVVDITVDRWSSPEEREQLIVTMLEKGPEALLRALQKVPVKGRFRIPGWQGPDPHQLGLGHDLRYAWQVPLPEGGRRIVIITDRYIGFQEARAQPRTIDYPFTLFEIRVNKAGEGEGKMAVATKISFDKSKRQIELENYGSEPVRLNSVKVKPRT